MYPAHRIELFHSEGRFAFGHRHNCLPIVFDYLAADISEFAAFQFGMCFQYAKEVTRFDRDMLAGVTDENDALALLLSQARTSAPCRLL